MAVNKYWKTLKYWPTASKEKNTARMHNWENVFTSIAVIRENLYINQPKNINNVYKDTKDLVSIIKALGKYKWKVHSVLWWSKTYRLGKNRPCPKTFTRQNDFGSIWNMFSWRLSFDITQSIDIIYSYKTNFCAFIVSWGYVL